MAKDPAVLFYTSDFLSGTTFFTDEQTGQYVRLLCHQHQLGHIPFGHMTKTLSTSSNPVWTKFIKDENGLYYNIRLDEEKEKRISYCKSRVNNKEGKNQYSKNNGHMTPHMTGHMTGHMENEDINRTSVNTTTLKKHLTTAFEDVWSKYPRREGKKEALRHFLASVKTEKDLDDIYIALNNYCNTKNVLEGNREFIQQGSRWFNNWRDYLDMAGVTGKSKELMELEALTKAK
jgi:uncharacterized protein YdaU (DUF1376 family)